MRIFRGLTHAPWAQFRSADVGVGTSGNADVGYNSLNYRQPSTVVHIGECPSVQVAVLPLIPVPSAHKVPWVAVQTKLRSPQSTVSSTTSLPRPRRSYNSVTASSSGLLRMKHEGFFHLLLTQLLPVGSVWRPLVDHVVDCPLALCDSRTISGRDLVECDLVYPRYEGEYYLLYHSDTHKWFYWGEQSEEEVIVFQNFDSHGNTRTWIPSLSFRQYPVRPLIINITPQAVPIQPSGAQQQV